MLISNCVFKDLSLSVISLERTIMLAFGSLPVGGSCTKKNCHVKENSQLLIVVNQFRHQFQV